MDVHGRRDGHQGRHKRHVRDSRRQPRTATSLLGAVPGYESYSVPGAAAGTRFDQFPGAPAVDGSTVVFKGNYTESGVGRTGVFYRVWAVGSRCG